MYSGGSDSTESQTYTQWALNPSTYQNVASDQVDWAALAQQWIIMKEAGPPPLQQQALVQRAKKDVPNEGGEAPMDVENDKEDDGGGQQQQPPPPPPWTNVNVPPPGDSWTWNAQQQQWGWNNTWTAPPPSVPKPPLLPTPTTGYGGHIPAGGAGSGGGGGGAAGATAPGDGVNETSNYGSYNSTSNDYNSGYWNSGGNAKQKPHNKRFSKVNPPRQPVVPEPVTLDAAKRKQLPAWIREGLEKMERDKQKQIEREREKQESETYTEKVKLSEKDAMEIIKSTVKENKARYESENDTDADDADTAGSDFRGKTPEPVPLTQEELMLKVRRTMTEILLNVTNREIQQICKEELQRYFIKNKASGDRVSATSGTNFSAKLGLGMYGGDSTGSSSEDSEDDVKKPDTRDSDTELKEIIKRRKAEFSKIEREIEEKLAEAEKTADDQQSRGGTPETNDNDSQVDAKHQARKNHHNSSPERTTPPPPPIKQTQHRSRRKSSSGTDEASSSDHEHERKKSKRRKRKSSSTDSGSSNRRSVRRSKTKRRSRSRSSRRRRTDSSHRQYARRTRSRSRSRSSRRRGKRTRSRSRHRRSRSRDSSYRSSSRRSRSRRRSSSSSRKSYHRRRSRSSSSGGGGGGGRGKRSHRH